MILVFKCKYIIYFLTLIKKLNLIKSCSKTHKAFFCQVNLCCEVAMICQLESKFCFFELLYSGAINKKD